MRLNITASCDEYKVILSLNSAKDPLNLTTTIANSRIIYAHQIAFSILFLFIIISPEKSHVIFQVALCKCF